MPVGLFLGLKTLTAVSVSCMGVSTLRTLTYPASYPNNRSVVNELRMVGSPGWTRTNDQRINSPTLYQLSYRGADAMTLNRRPRIL
jgi:hypothetical protein